MFQFCDVVKCVAKSVDLDFAKRQHLMTDGAISGGNSVRADRELVQWKADEDDDMQLQELEVVIF